MAVTPMASLHHCAPMDVPEPLPRSHHHHFLSPPPFPITYLVRFLSSYSCHRPPHNSMARLALCTGSHNIRTTTSAMSVSNGKTTMTFRDYSDIVWIVEAEIAEDQCLYIAGDPIELGCWKPEMAIPMALSQEANIWKVEVKIPCGMSFKYNYLVKSKTLGASDVIWRQGPQFSLLVPQYSEEDRKIMVRDSWVEVGSRSRRSLGLVWGSWIEEGYLPVEPSGSSSVRGDEHGIVKLLEAKPVLTDGKSDQIYSSIENMVSLTCEGYASDTSSIERKQPVEEPWLMTSLVSPLFTDIDFHAMEEENHHSGMTEMLAAEGKDLVKAKDSVSTVILISSSICTMQRIAVLEDDELVELLLEPVKSNVQCDSVYLGIVMKLVPHMGGAFVNIGSSRHSLMDIKQNQEPFIFPPFVQGLRRQEVDSSAKGSDEGHSDVFEDEDTSHEDAEVVDDVAEIFSQESLEKHGNYDYEENKDEDDFELPEAPKGSSNGSLIGFASMDHEDINESGGTKNHNEGEPSDCPTPVVNDNSSQMSPLQVAKDSMYTSSSENQWSKVRKGTKIIVQVVKEGLGTKGPTLTAYPKLRSRFWVLLTQCDRIGVSKKIVGVERTRLKVIAKTLQPRGFGLTVRTVAAGHSLEELQKDLEGLLSTWKNIIEHAKSAALAADEGVEGAVPVILHRAMGQTLSVVQDYFNDKVKKMVVDSPRNFHEVTNYLQEIAPDLCDRVQLYDKRNPLFDEYNIEAEIDNILSKRVLLANGGSLVIEQTEALVSIDVNGGHGMFREGKSQEKAVLDVNLAAARQIAREIRLRDIGGIIVVDFIDMEDESNKRLVYEEVKKAVERDRSMLKVSELSKHGLMEITRKRVRPSVTFMISEPCSCCHATGRVEALETSFLKIEQEICRMLASTEPKADPEDPKSWSRFVLRVDHHMCEYLTSGKKTRIASLSSSLKVWILLKVARGFVRGEFEVKPFGNDNKTNKNHNQVVIPILRPRDGRGKDKGKKVTVFPVKKWKTSG